MTEATADKPVAKSITGNLPAGVFMEMVGERWFKCTDVNADLNPDLSKIGLLLEGVGYDHAVGLGPRDCKTFTLRQFYRDDRPTLDYTDEQVTLLVRGWKRHIEAPEYWAKLEKVLRAGIKEFERRYKGLGDNMEERADQIERLTIDEKISEGLTTHSGPSN